MTGAPIPSVCQVTTHRMIRSGLLFLGFVLLALALGTGRGAAQNTAEQDRIVEELATYIVAPYALGTQEPGLPVWKVLDGGGALSGYVFQSASLSPIPGFAGAPINMVIHLDRDGVFRDVQVIDQNEPVFVSGLGEAPMHAFAGQYRGLAVTDPISVGPPGPGRQTGTDATGASVGGPVQVDGVAKATASVRIMNETILAAALQVARQVLADVVPRPVAPPRQDFLESLSWPDLLRDGLVTHVALTAAERRALFAEAGHGDTGFGSGAGEDPETPVLELWVADLSVPSVAAALLDPETKEVVSRYVLPHEEGLLLIARHGAEDPVLTGPDFVRNSALERLSIVQDGFTLAIRDADVDPIAFQPGALPDGLAELERLVVRADRRLGFNPASPWQLAVQLERARGSFMPEIQTATLSVPMDPDDRFYGTAIAPSQTPPWLQAWQDRWVEIAVVSVILAFVLAGALWQRRLGRSAPRLAVIRIGVPVVTLILLGWWAQAQLSIVTPLGVLGSVRDMITGAGGTLIWLLYDPTSLLVWAVALVGVVVWGRGLFCGWLCPFGAFQELVSALARRLGLRERRVPVAWDRRLKAIKYGVLAGLVGTVLILPDWTSTAVEVEPFKTAITLGFDRAWPAVAWAVGLLMLSALIYKGFCRYLCPLGAALAALGALRRWDWIPRRTACGSPCQLCANRCRYQAIEERDPKERRTQGRIVYSECFQCLDCVAIHDDAAQCVPLILAAKGRSLPIQPVGTPKTVTVEDPV